MLATLLLVFAFLVIGGIKIQATAVASHKIETIWAEEPKCVRLTGEQGVEWGGWEHIIGTLRKCRQQEQIKKKTMKSVALRQLQHG